MNRPGPEGCDFAPQSEVEHRPTRASILAAEDQRIASEIRVRRFSTGSRPVIRWIKGDGLDDLVTRAAIGQATRLFGSQVDYCLCTQGLDAVRVHRILEWAAQPVEWWPISERDNPQLAQFLADAGCPSRKFGYWWKWFPERVRPEAPEWILDGDMVITDKPAWFPQWVLGRDVVRVAQDDIGARGMYGQYASHVDLGLKLYSGLVSLSPGCRYMANMADVLTEQPLLAGHDGMRDMCEQGVVVATFQRLKPQPIPLHEFPFARAFQEHLDFGRQGDQGRAWGYHFGNAFIRHNPHFDRLSAEGVVFSRSNGTDRVVDLVEKFHWLGGTGQWGIPGWAMTDGIAKLIVEHAATFSGRPVLEVGTSRGHLTAMLAALGCQVTTVDHQDRGAGQNLEGLSVAVVHDDAAHFLATKQKSFDLIVCDLHGNSPADWKRFATALLQRLRPGGTLIISNASLSEIPEWQEETGVHWFLKQLPSHWQVELKLHIPPGLAIVLSPPGSNPGSRLWRQVVNWPAKLLGKLKTDRRQRLPETDQS